LQNDDGFSIATPHAAECGERELRLREGEHRRFCFEAAMPADCCAVELVGSRIGDKREVIERGEQRRPPDLP
jgi:hypothetical protein